MPDISFLQTGFLSAAAIAAGLPLLIHLLFRQRAKQLDIGSVRFLRDVIREHTRRRRIRRWLLLALRVLAVLLLGMLFARPFLDRSRLLGLNQEVLLLIDCSASMGVLLPEEGTAFDHARVDALQTMKGLDDNAIVRTGLFDVSGVCEILPSELNQERAPGEGATDYTIAMAWARDILTLSSRPRRRIHIWTDLQKSGIRGHVNAFPADVELVVHDVGPDMMHNICVEQAKATAVEIRPENPVTVTCRLRNAGVLPTRAVTAELRLLGPSDSIHATDAVDLAGGKAVEIVFPLKIHTPGVYRGELRLEYDDDLACDNRRFLAFEVRRPDRVLLADGQLGSSVYTNETYFLETALRLDVPQGDRPSRTYEVERIDWEDGEGFPDLTGFRAVVLANVGALSTIDLRRLHEYVVAGGRLLVFAGDQMLPSTVAALHEVGLAPGTIALTSKIGRFRASSWSDDHPLLSPFQDPYHGDLRQMVFRRMLQWKALDEPSRVLIRAGDAPLMIEHQLEKGKIVYVGTTADREWSDWPQDRLYVPFVRQVMAYLTDQLADQQLVQSAFVGTSGESAGIEEAEEVICVRNLDPLESRPERVTSEAFQDGLGLPDVARREDPDEVALPVPRTAQRQDEAWPLVMWLLLAVLGMETLLASRIHA